MRNLFALIGFIVVVVVGVGFWRGWYKIDWEKGSNGKLNIQIQADTNRGISDLKEAGEAVVEKGGQIAESLKNEKKDPPADFVGPPLPKQNSGPASLPSPR